MNLYTAVGAERLAAIIRRRYGLSPVVERAGGGTHAVVLRAGDLVYTLGVETLAGVEIGVWLREVWDGESTTNSEPLRLLEFDTGAEAALHLRAEIDRQAPTSPQG